MTFEQWKEAELLKGNLAPAILHGKVYYPYSWDCPWAKKYHRHLENQALRHGTDLSFDDYLLLAYQAGIQLTDIGNKKGKYQLGRVNDTGRYSLSNCRFILFEQNRQEMTDNGGAKQSGLTRSGTNNCNYKGKVTTPLGVFDTRKEAAKAHNIHESTLRYRLKHWEDYSETK